MTRASRHLENLLEKHARPVLTPVDFYILIRQMYQGSTDKKLYLRKSDPGIDDYHRLKRILIHAGIVRNDRDYRARALRVLTVSDRPAEEIACLIDPTCHVSYLSAMERWGLTNRSPKALMLSQPHRKSALEKLRRHRQNILGQDLGSNIFPLHLIRHPIRVRGGRVQMYMTKLAGANLTIRGSDARISTIGQTFLDMLQKPDLCGGMPHILEVWEQHAETYLDSIVAAVDTATNGLVKCRAGYILQEYLGLGHSRISNWKAFAQRGGSRKLDPSQHYAPTYSETWMISINV
ncbi:MAG: hypothetical protein F4246_03090 [Rhodothermaceae bacterium]|nr:hypothetical protein [Rhodothermaceae bacterium]MYD55983.1 hypothetical protein [Rhodothermaceae bacterium]MYJ56146.1 hypothetical protein [Rhodothermaceae bacterium]